MAGTKRNRSDLNTEDVNVYLPDNITQLIDPVEHRQSNQDMMESCINRLDDNIEPQPSDSSLEYTVDPTSLWADSGAADEQKVPNKKYVDERFQVPDVVRFFVSKNGNDTTAQPGQEHRPYLTIQAACDAMGAGSYILDIAPGTYTESVVQINQGQANLMVLLNGITLNGRLNVSNAVTNVYVLGGNSIIDDSTTVNVVGFNPSGLGYMDSVTITSANLALSTALDFQLTTAKKIYRNVNVNVTQQAKTVVGQFGYFYDCNLTATVKSTLDRVFDCEFHGTYIESTTNNGIGEANAPTRPSKFYNCDIKGATNGIVGEICLYNWYYNCRIRAVAGIGITVASTGANDNQCKFIGCEVRSSSHAIQVTTSARTATDLLFKDMVIVAGGKVIDDPGLGLLDPNFTDRLLLVNSVVNKALVINNPLSINDLNNTVVTSMVLPNILP